MVTNDDDELKCDGDDVTDAAVVVALAVDVVLLRNTCAAVADAAS